MPRATTWIAAAVGLAVLGGIGTGVTLRLLDSPAESGRRGADGPPAVPVEVAPVRSGPIERRRIFSGTLEAAARITIAPKVQGRIESMPVDLADLVRRGDVVARLDGAEFAQELAQAEAELAVARASLTEAESAAAIALRELERVRTLHEREIASDSQLDAATAAHLSADAAVAVARAGVTRAEAALERARIRLDYATIRADWEGGDETRVVADRYAEEGDTVAANTPLLSIIELDPIDAVITATEREYARLAPGQPVSLGTDAHPGRRWEGRVARVAPSFAAGSRQARVEIRVPNPGGDLKPGMFCRVRVVLDRVEDATLVPAAALTERGGEPVIFVVDEAAGVARAVPVTPGIRDGDVVELVDVRLDGPVVVLGQHLLEDGTPVRIPEPAEAVAGGPAAGGTSAADPADDASADPAPAAAAASRPAGTGTG